MDKVTFVLEQKKLADINNDGAIDSKDASLLNTMIGRINYEPGDVDRNEKITLNDAKLVLDFCLVMLNLMKNNWNWPT